MYVLDFIVFIFGICIGSFLNVLIDRLPEGQSVVAGRSHCDFCKKTLRWWELVPLFSFLLQRGKSACCHKKLSWQYPLIELVTGIGFVSLYPYNFAYLIIFSSLLAVFVADLKTQIIPDELLIIALVAELFLRPDMSSVFPAIAGTLFIFLIWLFTRGRGMGFGDVKLIFVLGLLTPYPGIIITLYTAFLTGAAVGVILILGKQKSLKSKIAFGPFLIAGTVISILFQTQIVSWWKGVL